VPLKRTIKSDRRSHAKGAPRRGCTSATAQLVHADATVRRHAVRDIVTCDGASEAIISRLFLEVDASVREAMLNALATRGDTAAVAGLLECLRGEDVVLRNDAVSALTRLPAAVAQIIEPLLADERADVRILLVNVLESLRHPQVESWLIGIIERDAHVNVCATALDLLGEVGTEAAAAPLQRLKARFADQPYIQFAADLALERITAV